MNELRAWSKGFIGGVKVYFDGYAPIVKVYFDGDAPMTPRLVADFVVAIDAAHMNWWLDASERHKKGMY